MFPLGPPGMSNSPYQVLSAFAGNPLFIDLEDIVQDGLLSRGEIKPNPAFPSDHVPFGDVWRFKKMLFRKAFALFQAQGRADRSDFREFCMREAAWLDDYALFCALKEKHRGASWVTWEAELRDRKPSAMERSERQLRSSIRYHQFLQFVFFRQWERLRAEAKKNGVAIVGDIPIFVAHDSADVWANPHLYWLDKEGYSTAVAGVPPDYFSQTGQRWGNPLYRWDKMKREGYRWWVRRFRSLFKMVDAARIDHFIGFRRYWNIPARSDNAINGKWMDGPGEHFFKTVFERCGKLALIAEDLGVVGNDVIRLRDAFNLPGMKVLQFAFGSDTQNPFLPHNHIRNCVVYTGTHDNDTTVGWSKDPNCKRDRAQALRYTGTSGRRIHWDMIRLAQGSVANTAIVPLQDFLGLDSRARMNLPGTPDGNWTWRFESKALSPALARRMKNLSETYGR